MCFRDICLKKETLQQLICKAFSQVKSSSVCPALQETGKAWPGEEGCHSPHRRGRPLLCPRWWKFGRFLKLPEPPRLELWPPQKRGTPITSLPTWNRRCWDAEQKRWREPRLAKALDHHLAPRPHLTQLLSPRATFQKCNYTAGTVHRCTLECERTI